MLITMAPKDPSKLGQKASVSHRSNMGRPKSLPSVEKAVGLIIDNGLPLVEALW